MSKKLLVFAAPATPIADLHLGHLAGPYLGADAFTRYQRMKGREVTFIAFTRDHDERVARRAELLGMSPADAVLTFSAQIRNSLHSARIEPDAFVTPSQSPTYTTQVGSVFTDLWKRGHLTVRETPAFYCPTCKRGPANCPRCGGEYRGDICRKCARPILVGEAMDAPCSRCSGPLVVRRRRSRLIFDLKPLRSRLADYHSPPRLADRSRQLVEEILATDLGDFPLDTLGNWGLEVTLADLQSFRLDIAAELGACYPAISAASPGQAEEFRTAWEDEGVEVVQFLGFDDTFAHAILQPALLMAADVANLPSRFVVNDLLLLGDEKFSASRPNAIWAGELLRRIPADFARYFLCLSSPGTKPERITSSQFHHRITQKLLVEIGAPLEALLRDLSSTERIAPWESRWYESPLEKAIKGAEEMGRHLETDGFSLRKAGRIWRDMAAQLIAFCGGDRGTAWQRYADEVATALTVVASCAYPLMPEFAGRLWKALGIERPLATHPWGVPVHLASRPRSPSQDQPLFPALPNQQDEEFLPVVTVGR